MQSLYVNWRLHPGYNRYFDHSEIRSGIHDWALWRTKLNENLIITSLFNTPLLLNKLNTNFILDKNDFKICQEISDPEKHDSNLLFKIEPKIARFIYCLEFKKTTIQQKNETDNKFQYNLNQNTPLLDPESYMFYGLPRINIQNKSVENLSFTKFTTHAKTKQSQITKNIKSFKNNQILCGDHKETMDKKQNSKNNCIVNKNPLKLNSNNIDNICKNSSDPIITGINVKEKVKAFEHVNKPVQNKIKLQAIQTSSNQHQKNMKKCKGLTIKYKNQTPQKKLENIKIYPDSSPQTSFFNSSNSVFLGMNIIFSRQYPQT